MIQYRTRHTLGNTTQSPPGGFAQHLLHNLCTVLPLFCAALLFWGHYENNEKAGQATLFDADGNLIYSGGWQNGKRQGHGTAFDKNGNVVYTGEWKDDRYENGILYRHVQNEDKA